MAKTKKISKRQKPQKTKVTFAKRFRRWFILFLVLLGIFVLMMSLGVGILLSYIKSLPPIEELENYKPPQMSEVYDNTGKNIIARFSVENREVVSYKDIPKNLIYAFVSIEDARFFEHFGFDIKRLISAAIIDIKRRKFAQGASTITQQIPRNLLPEITKEKKIIRKIKETLIAFKIESSYSKEQILEFYLNQIYLGRRSYGIKSAARTYFNKDLKDLTLAECASLAAIPQQPNLYSPTRNPQKNVARRNIILKYMYNFGHITKKEYEKAITEPLVTRPPAPFFDNAPYFADYVYKLLLKDPDFDMQDIKTEGLRISTTVDLEIQKICREELSVGLREVEKMWQDFKLSQLIEQNENPDFAIIKKGQVRLAKIDEVSSGVITVSLQNYKAKVKLPEELPYYNPSYIIKKGKLIDVYVKKFIPETDEIDLEFYDKGTVQGAIVVLDAHTGDILALSGGESFYDMKNNGMWNRAVQAERQPGSGFKPFFYAVAFDDGYNLSTVFDDSPLIFPDGYAPKNYENKFFGPTTLMEALEHSRNVVTIKLSMAMGLKRGINLVKKFDIPEIENSWNMPPYPTVCLGNVTVTPLEITAAYIPFINAGIEFTPRAIKEISNVSGKLNKKNKAKEKVVISPQAAYMTTYALMGTITRGTAVESIGGYFENKKGYPQLAGKTGTTNDCNDAWFIGYTPDIVMGIFMGFDQNKTLGPKMTGSRVTGKTWSRIMDRIIQTKPMEEWQMKFKVPPNTVLRDVCSHTGMIAKKSCSSSGALVYYGMPFKKGSEPTQECTKH